MPIRKKIALYTKTKTDCESFRVTQIIFTFLLTTFAWIFFRADSIASATGYITRICTRLDPWVLFDGSLYLLGINQFDANVLFVALLILFIVDLIRYHKGIRIDVFLERQNIWFRWLFIIVLLIMIGVYGAYGHEYNAKQFIYFQF